MTQALLLNPIRAVTYLNDFLPHRVHVVGLGCEAAFTVRLETSPKPGRQRRAVALQENHGFTLEQAEILMGEIAAAYPGMSDRTYAPLTEEGFAYATSDGEQATKDPGSAVAARYLPDRERLEVTFSPTEVREFDLRVFEELATASAADLGAVELSPAGLGIYFPRLNVGLSALMLYRDRFERPPEDED